VSGDPHGELAEELRLLVETVLERMEPSVTALIDHVTHNVPGFTETGPPADSRASGGEQK